MYTKEKMFTIEIIIYSVTDKYLLKGDNIVKIGQFKICFNSSKAGGPGGGQSNVPIEKGLNVKVFNGSELNSNIFQAQLIKKNLTAVLKKIYCFVVFDTC